MKVIVHKENLQRALGFVEKITSKNASLPILSNILLKTENGCLKLAATNLEVGITTTIGANVTEDGGIAVPGRILSDFVRGIRNDTVALEVKQNVLNIDAGKFKTSILCFDAGEYPIIPKVETKDTRTIPTRMFRSMIAGVIDSIALSESRPELTGALLSFATNTTTLAATDGFRLAERRAPAQNTSSAAVIIPRGTVIELSRVLSDIEDDTQVVVADNQISFVHSDFEIVSRLIDGKYPDYHKVIPERFTSKVLVRKDDLENAVKVAAVFSSSISDIKIACTPETIQVTSKNATRGEAQAVIEANTKGDPFEVTVNYHYLLDGLKIIETDKVVMEFTGKGGPFVLRPHDDKREAVYLIMPLRN